MDIKLNSKDYWSNVTIDTIKEDRYIIENINSSEVTGNILFHDAVEFASQEVIRFLLDNSADVTSIDRYGNTTFHRAMGGFNRKKAVSIAKDLKEAGADPKLLNYEGCSIFHSIAFNKFTNFPKNHMPFLNDKRSSLSNDEELFFPNDKIYQFIMELNDWGVNKDAKTKNEGETALFYTVRNLDFYMMKAFNLIGFDVNAVDNDDNSLFHHGVFAYFNGSDDSMKVMDILNIIKANIFHCNKYTGETPRDMAQRMMYMPYKNRDPYLIFKLETIEKKMAKDKKTKKNFEERPNYIL